MADRLCWQRRVLVLVRRPAGLSGTAIVIGLLIIVGNLLYVRASQAATLPSGFADRVVLSGLTQPTTVEFSPDGRVFVAEKSGLVKVFQSLTATTPTAQQARRIDTVVPDKERELLLAAAWLHDIGYAPSLALTGFHALDGARHLDRLGIDRRLCSLVAHHSEARFEAEERGPSAELALYDRESGPLTDALAYADMTIGPAGEELPRRPSGALSDLPGTPRPGGCGRSDCP